MDLKEGIPFTESEQYLAIETANKLHILYVFEDGVGYTDSFKETIKIIYEQDGFWEEYNDYLNLPENPNSDEIWKTSLWRMAGAFISIHLVRLEIPYELEEWLQSIQAVHMLFSINLEESLQKIIRVRDADYDFLTMIGVDL